MASLIQRNGTYYLQWYNGPKLKRRSLRTESLQIAKEKLRQFESAKLRGLDNPLPTRTPTAEVLAAYVQHIRTHKTPKSAQTDVYYLREAFGPICEPLQITSRRVTEKSRKRKLKPGQDRRCTTQRIEASHFEAITTADISHFIVSLARARGLAPKTCNRYREIIHRLFTWAMKTQGIRLPASINPARDVERFKERAPQIRYLTLQQIDEQLHALRFKPQLQAMVAMYIYAGLRREEAVWLTVDDVKLRAGGHGMIQVRAKVHNGERWQPKTRSNRGVPISRALRKYLDRHTVRPSDGPGSGWYFPSPNGQRWDADNFSNDLRAANRDAGLQWTCLDYRHTFGSQLAQNGVSLYKIATLMGNSPEICRRHYAALVPENMAEEVEFKMPAATSTSRAIVG